VILMVYWVLFFPFCLVKKIINYSIASFGGWFGLVTCCGKRK
jgi:succinate-acetate transporter protein